MPNYFLVDSVVIISVIIIKIVSEFWGYFTFTLFIVLIILDFFDAKHLYTQTQAQTHKPTAENVMFEFRGPQNMLTPQNLHCKNLTPKNFFFCIIHGWEKVIRVQNIRLKYEHYSIKIVHIKFQNKCLTWFRAFCRIIAKVCLNILLSTNVLLHYCSSFNVFLS